MGPPCRFSHAQHQLRIPTRVRVRIDAARESTDPAGCHEARPRTATLPSPRASPPAPPGRASRCALRRSRLSPRWHLSPSARPERVASQPASMRSRYRRSRREFTVPYAVLHREGYQSRQPATCPGRRSPPAPRMDASSSGAPHAAEFPY